MLKYERKIKIEPNTEENIAKNDALEVKGEKLTEGFVKVYFAKTGEADLPTYPKERTEEILGVKSQKAKIEKSSDWALLEFAVKDVFGKNLTDYSFKKQNNGKWVSDGFYFSLTHSDGAVGVALSNLPVGFDIESISSFEKKTALKKDAFLKKICTDNEYEKYKNASIGRLSAIWTAKESVFKSSDESFFDYKKADLNLAKSMILNLFGKDYSASVCAIGDYDTEYFIVE